MNARSDALDLTVIGAGPAYTDRAGSAGKIGDCELEALVKYEASGRDPGAFFDSIAHRGHELDLLYVNCGVFPRRPDAIAAWADGPVEPAT